MKTPHRVLNGMKARGIPKSFSVEERQRRRERMPEVLQARLKKIRERKEAVDSEKALVKQMAQLGIFVPIGARLVRVETSET